MICGFLLRGFAELDCLTVGHLFAPLAHALGTFSFLFYLGNGGITSQNIIRVPLTSQVVITNWVTELYNRYTCIGYGLLSNVLLGSQFEMY